MYIAEFLQERLKLTSKLTPVLAIVAYAVIAFAISLLATIKVVIGVAAVGIILALIYWCYISISESEPFWKDWRKTALVVSDPPAEVSPTTDTDGAAASAQDVPPAQP